MVAQQVPLPLLEVADQTYSSRLSLSSTPVLAQVPVQRVERVEELEDRVARVVPEEAHRDQRHEVLDSVGHVRVELSRRHADSQRLLLVAVAADALEEADERGNQIGDEAKERGGGGGEVVVFVVEVEEGD